MFTRHNGVFWFAFARKVAAGQRQRGGPISGAAGTQEQYWGRWSSFGGTKNQADASDLLMAYEELEDEGDLPSSIQNKLRLKHATMVQQHSSCTSVFIFEFPDSQEFFHYFPQYPHARANGSIVKRSKGEIDAVASFTMQMISERSDRFVSYVVKSIQSVLIPEICKISKAFNDKWGKAADFRIVQGPRQPEHAFYRYWEMCHGPETIDGKCAYENMYYTTDWPTKFPMRSHK